MDISDAKVFLEEHRITTVLVGGSDQIGALRGKRMPTSYFLQQAGTGFRFAWFLLNTGSVDTPVEGILDDGVPDVVGRPDLPSLRRIPWEPDAAFVFMDWFWEDGRPCELCPRGLLKSQIERMDRELDLAPVFALELEFTVLANDPAAVRRGGWNDIELFTQDKHCYSLYEGHFYEPFIAELRTHFSEQIEGCTPEWGEGQFEANLRKAPALEMADTAALFKMATKQIAAKHGVMATFMAKLREGLSGSSGHIHHSLVDPDTGETAIYEAGRRYDVSGMFEHYIAGLYELCRETTLFFAPYVNSYKRFELDSFAGVTKSWGIDNRTVAYRLINESPGACRIEDRIGGADLNPYTAFAVTIAKGLWGVRQKHALPEAMTGNCYHIPGIEMVPTNLYAARDLTKGAPEIREILPARFVDNYLAIVTQELQEFETIVTDLERRRYLEMA
ncbi:MAG: glutamine synthetase family protein [Pseudomonadota bacterium]